MKIIETISKKDAIEQIKKIFKGNQKFILYCELLIASTEDFRGIESYDIQMDTWNWEKFLRLTINFSDNGFKILSYRKGNKKYSPENTFSEKGNTTSNIHDYSIVVYINNKSEKYTWLA